MTTATQTQYRMMYIAAVTCIMYHIEKYTYHTYPHTHTMYISTHCFGRVEEQKIKFTTLYKLQVRKVRMKKLRSVELSVLSKLAGVEEYGQVNTHEGGENP